MACGAAARPPGTGPAQPLPRASPPGLRAPCPPRPRCGITPRLCPACLRRTVPPAREPQHPTGAADDGPSDVPAAGLPCPGRAPLCGAVRSREGTRLHRDLRPVNNLFLLSDKKLKKIHLVGLNIPFLGYLARSGGYMATGVHLSDIRAIAALPARRCNGCGDLRGSSEGAGGRKPVLL